mgnify:FL=1
MFSSQQLTELLNEPFGAIANDIEKLQRLVQYYQHIYGVESCIGCGGKNKYEQFYITLKNEGISIMENKENTSFEFNKGVTLVPMKFGSNKFITPTTLTDELALEFLANNENRITLFAKFPEDWKEQVEAFKEKQAEAATTETKTAVTTTGEEKKDLTVNTETVIPVEEEKQAEAATTETKTATKGATKGK